jgi:hypothetical protein
MTDAELSATLVHVRRASRLLVAYQRRMNEVFYRVHLALDRKGLKHRWWGSDRHKTPARSHVAQFAPVKWAWDLYPGLTLAAEWCSEGALPLRRVYLALDTDTGFDTSTSAGEPDPTKFALPPEEAHTRLRAGLYTASGQAPPWVQIRVNALEGRWHHAVGRDIDWKWECWSGTYQYLEVPVASLISGDAVQDRLVAPLAAWADRHAPGAPR